MNSKLDLRTLSTPNPILFSHHRGTPTSPPHIKMLHSLNPSQNKEQEKTQNTQTANHHTKNEINHKNLKGKKS